MADTRSILVPLCFVLLIGGPAAALAVDESMDAAQSAYEAGDYQVALEIWLLRAYEGDAEAQYRLGRTFSEGTGTVVDAAEAAYWFNRAAEQGHAEAQFELGNAYLYGAGLNPDKVAALEWWQVAAENGHPEAQYHLGRAYFYGIDLEQDSRLAVEWFTRAADTGHEEARQFLERIGVLAAPADAAVDAATEADSPGYARVDQRPVWIYSSFNRLSPILTRLDAGSLLRIVERRIGWFGVEVPGGLPVWVEQDALSEDGAVARAERAGIPLRPDPENDPDISALGMLDRAAEVTVLERRDGWLRVRAPETVIGWVEAIGVRELTDTTGAEEDWAALRERVAGHGEPDAPAVETIAQAAVADRAEGTSPPPAAPTPAAAGVSQLIYANPLRAEAVASGDVVRIGPEGQEMFARPRADSARIDRFSAGLLLRVEQVADGWVQVRVPGGLPLWIYDRFLDIDGDRGRITGRGVRARPLPSTASESQPVGAYPEGAEVRIMERAGNWVRIRAPEELTAWALIEGLFEVALDGQEAIAEWRVQAAGGITGDAVLATVELASAADVPDPPEAAPAVAGEEQAVDAPPAEVAGQVEEAAAPDSPPSADKPLAEELAKAEQPPEAESADVADEVAVVAPTESDAEQPAAAEDAATESVAATEPVEPVTAAADDVTADRQDGTGVAGVESAEVAEASADPTSSAPEAGESPAGEAVDAEPVAEEPVAEEPVAEEPVAEEPVADEPVADEPVADAPVADEPVADAPVASEPVASEPVAGTTPDAAEPAVSGPPEGEPTLAAAASKGNPASDPGATVEGAQALAGGADSTASGDGEVVSEPSSSGAAGEPETDVGDTAESAERLAAAPPATGAEGAGEASTGPAGMSEEMPRAVDAAGESGDGALVAEDSTAPESGDSADPEVEPADAEPIAVAASGTTGDGTAPATVEEQPGDSQPVAEANAGEGERAVAAVAATPMDTQPVDAAAIAGESAAVDGSAVETDAAPVESQAVVEDETSDRSEAGSDVVDSTQPVATVAETAGEAGSTVVATSSTADPAPAAAAEQAAEVAAVADTGEQAPADTVVAAAAPQQPADDGQTPPAPEPSAATDTGQADAATGEDADAVPVRFDDLAWLYRQHGDRFTIELMRESTREAVLDGVARAGLVEPMYAFSRLVDGARRFNLMHGAFPELAGVQQALADLQPHFQNIRIRRLGALQTEWCRQVDNLTPEQLLLILEKCAR